jgi:SAM-dependent methyltransferase
MPIDRHSLYEASVQGVEFDLDFAASVFRRLRGRPARVLREDFCGTAALSGGWVMRSPSNVAYGIDLDPEPLAWASRNRLSRLNGASRVHLVRGDVLHARVPPADLTLAYNFSFFVFKTRPLLLEYFRAARRGLRKDGVLMLGMFGGTEACEAMSETRHIPSQQAVDGTRLPAFRYVWEQESFNPVTHDLFCSIHFEVPGRRVMRRAFTYDWRLWSLPEVRELLEEAGFRSSQVYVDVGDSGGVYRKRTSFENQRGWLALVAGIR